MGTDCIRTVAGPNDSGGASRFFYVSKASRAEREAGLEGMPIRDAGEIEDDAYGAWPTDGKGNPEVARRGSPTTTRPSSPWT